MVEELDKEQIKMLKNAFNAFDQENKGTIKCDMVGTILEMLGQQLDEKQLKAVIMEVDSDRSGELDFDEFVQLASKFIEPDEDLEAVAKELKEAFRLYDKEGKGYLPVETLRDILHELDEKLSPSDLDMMIDEIDADGSGTVDFEEFMDVMIG